MLTKIISVAPPVADPRQSANSTPCGGSRGQFVIMFPSISRLFLRWRGAKVYSQTGWETMTGFAPFHPPPLFMLGTGTVRQQKIGSLAGLDCTLAYQFMHDAEIALGSWHLLVTALWCLLHRNAIVNRVVNWVVDVVKVAKCRFSYY